MAYKSNGHYVNNAEFYQELKEWIIKRNKDIKTPITESIVKKIQLIVTGYSYRPNFINYSFIDRMRSEAIYTCMRYAHNFNYEKHNNPFAYFSQICWSSFVKIILLERKVSTLKKDLVDRFYFDNISGQQHVKVPRAKDYKYMFSTDFKTEPEPFSPVKVKLDGKKYTIETEEEWNKFCKKHKKQKKEDKKKEEKKIVKLKKNKKIKKTFVLF